MVTPPAWPTSLSDAKKQQVIAGGVSPACGSGRGSRGGLAAVLLLGLTALEYAPFPPSLPLSLLGHRYALPLGPLAPRETTLTLACREPAIVANDVLHNDDPRALGLAVGSWRLEKSALVR